MSESSAAAKRRMRRIPAQLRKRNLQSCDWCRKRRCKCVPSTTGQGCVSCEQHEVRCSYTAPRKTRFYGSLDELSLRYRCLEAVVKGAFPNDDIATAAELVQLGRRLGYVMPDINHKAAYSDVKLDEIIRVPAGTPLPTPQTPESDPSGQSDGVKRGSGETWRPRTRANSEEPHVSLIRDTSGNEHYIGPSGTLNFLSQLRKLFDTDTTANPALAAAACPTGATKFAKDDAAQALEAEGEHRDEERRGEVEAGDAMSISRDSVPQVPRLEDGPSPGTVTSTIARDFTQLPAADMDEMLAQFPPNPVLETLTHSYFKNVHADFPLFHRATFEDEYELFVVQARRRPPGRRRGPAPDWGWIGCLHMMCVFGSISDPGATGLDHPELRRRCVMATRMLLPQFVSKCTLSNVRVLLLLSLFLHNNNERNAAWNLVGTATRISFALGLHRATMLASLRPQEREVRKWVFRTLYAFEQFLASSLGRPSGLQDVDVEVVPPRDGFLDGGDAQLAGLSLRLDGILAKTRLLHAGRARGTAADGAGSPPDLEGVLWALEEWKNEVARQAGCDVPRVRTGKAFLDETSAVDMDEMKAMLSWKTRAQLRAMLLLHIQYYYINIVATRPLLLRDIAKLRATTADPAPPGAGVPALSPHAESCVRHACQLAHLVVLLDGFGVINGLSGLDVFYAYCAAMVLILRLARAGRQDGGGGGGGDEEEETLSAVRELVSDLRRVMNRTQKGGSMRRFARVVDTFFEAVDKPSPRLKMSGHGHNGPLTQGVPAPHLQQQQQQQNTPFFYPYGQQQQQQQQQMTLNGQGLVLDPDLLGEHAGAAPRLGDAGTVGDTWLDLLPLSTFGGSGIVEGMFPNLEGASEGVGGHDWVDMQILLGAYGGQGPVM
ncbi:hypothetical protein S7711_04438 [Stachybotrys chartarum IBT 7711]|uniref:Zn(2)-C6 fungal-type domain-containing protein n=1 Tax=Stachybotrys chartarum (strain CBS 109288 / IBT 7711) TaxID=1280523 RepID=A0A084B5N3_STACB|nr:hypothetical protein S7711_04438 [Stachybotrys chartarum IBT 7711]